MTKPDMVEIHVVPSGVRLNWTIKVEGRKVATVYRQKDAESLAVFLGRLMEKATVKFHNRAGRITEERTFPHAADPQETPG